MISPSSQYCHMMERPTMIPVSGCVCLSTLGGDWGGGKICFGSVNCRAKAVEGSG